MRRTRRRWEKEVCFHDCWADLARRAREFTWSVVRLGTVPREESVEGEKHWRSEGLLGSTSDEGGLVEEGMASSMVVAVGKVTIFPMSGTLSNKPSIVSLKSRHKCHSLLTK